MNVNYLGEALLGEAGRRSAGCSVPRRAAAAGDRSHLGQDLDDLLADFAARPRAHDRRALRPARAAATARRPRPASRAATARSCRSSSTSTWRSTATRSSPPRSSCGRSTGRGSRKSQAGIALQAYIPDSFAHAAADQRLGPPARGGGRRAGHDPPREGREHGDGARRGVSLRGWPQAPYKTKLETDANYQRMLTKGMRPENLAAVRLGIASHNLFYARLRPGARRPSRGASTTCSSRCSKAWPTTSGGRCSS